MIVERQNDFTGEIYTNIESSDNNKKEKQTKEKTIFAGNLKLQDDPITQKRNEARKKANKIVADAFDQEKKIDNDMLNRSENIKRLQSNIGIAQDKLTEIETEKASLKETYAIKEDSVEEQDLKLLEKQRDSMNPISNTVLTKDETERLAIINAKGKTEYQSRSLELDSFGSIYDKEIADAKKVIVEENAIIRGVKIERLKTSPILDATQASEEVLKAAGDEIVGMLIDKSKEHIDTTTEEQQKNAEEKAEEEAKLEETLKQIKEKKDQMENAAESNKNDSADNKTIDIEISTENILKLEESKKDIKAEVEDIISKMKLVAEDIKGIVVDSKI